MPGWPATVIVSTPPRATRSKLDSRVRVSAARPYSFCGGSKRSMASALPSANRATEPLAVERGEAAAQVRREAGRALIAILGLLLQQLEHDVGEHLRHARVAVGRRHGLAGDMEVHHLERIGALVRQGSREQLVQRDAERVQIRAVVEAAVHSPRLLGRDVGERAFERGRRLELPAPRCAAESRCRSRSACTGRVSGS